MATVLRIRFDPVIESLIDFSFSQPAKPKPHRSSVASPQQYVGDSSLSTEPVPCMAGRRKVKRKSIVKCFSRGQQPAPNEALQPLLIHTPPIPKLPPHTLSTSC